MHGLRDAGMVNVLRDDDAVFDSKSAQSYCDHLNIVQLRNADQMETGFVAITREHNYPDDLPLFVSRWTGHDPQIVTATLHARYDIWAEAQNSGINLKASAPDAWAVLATRPLTP